jgi:hypothetical protein
VLFAGKWVEMENIMLSKVSQVQKAKGCVLSQDQYKYKQYYENQVILRGGNIREREGKRRKEGEYGLIQERIWNFLNLLKSP